MIDVNGSKKIFVENLIWVNTIGDSFRRANVYKSEFKESEKEKESLKKILHHHLQQLVIKHYKKTVSEEQHLENIVSLQKASNNEILNGEQLNYGVSQKMLNVYLKYQWCNGVIPTPPHFPVDRIIQEMLKCKPVVSWTKDIVSEAQYLVIIRHGKDFRDNKGYKSLAEMELELFQQTKT